MAKGNVSQSRSLREQNAGRQRDWQALSAEQKAAVKAEQARIRAETGQTADMYAALESLAQREAEPAAVAVADPLRQAADQREGYIRQHADAVGQWLGAVFEAYSARQWELYGFGGWGTYIAAPLPALHRVVADQDGRAGAGGR